MRQLGLAFAVAFVCVLVVRAIEPAIKDAADGGGAFSQAPSPKSGIEPVTVSQDPRFKLSKQSDGHFYAELYLDNTRVDALVDTGASMLALTAEDARRAGIRVKRSDFTHGVRTANGVAYAAPARVRFLEIGPFSLRQVDVLVMPEETLGTSLLGMSVLSQFGRIEMEPDAIYLEAR